MHQTVSDQSNGNQMPRTRRPRLTTDQQREIARLYTVDGASTDAIRERFSIGDSSLYRVLQKQRVPLRGRRGSASAPATSADGRLIRFRVDFKGERVFAAHDALDALRQAEAVGARDVFAIARAT